MTTKQKTNIPEYIALYSETGKLLRLINIYININTAATVNISENFPGIFECTTVKIFIWGSTYTIQPIAQRKSCTVILETIISTIAVSE